MIQHAEKRANDAAASPFVERSGREDEKDCPYPGHRADRNIEAGTPVDPIQPRILIDPAFHLADGLRRVALIACDKEGLCQPRQMLLSVQLVNSLRIGLI